MSINIGDLAENVAFYTEVLGLDVLPRPDADIAVDGAWLGLPDGRQVHLLVQESRPADGQHFAFEVDDLDAVLTELEGKGVRVSPPSTLAAVCRQSFTKDPSGNLLEFNQRL